MIPSSGCPPWPPDHPRTLPRTGTPTPPRGARPLRSAVGKQAMRQRAELVERSFAHILDRGGLRRTWLRGRENVHKRYLIHVAGHNLGLLMRLLIGAGTPKEAVARGWYFFVLLRTTDGATDAAILEVFVENSAGPALIVFTTGCDHRLGGTTSSSTGW